jgi:ketosteroid isomerase-like protein
MPAPGLTNSAVLLPRVLLPRVLLGATTHPVVGDRPDGEAGVAMTQIRHGQDNSEETRMTNHPSGSSAQATELEAFIHRSRDGLRHQVQGDSPPFLEVWSHADDVAILGAIGSSARGWEDVKTHLLAASKLLNWTTVTVEEVVTFATDQLAVSVAVERMTREVNRATEGRALRVTHVYRRERGGWRLVLRHANQVTSEDEDRERAILGHEPG